MYTEKERERERREKQTERARESDNLANIEMNREEEKENNDSIIVVLVVVAAPPIVDVKSMTLSLPDQLPVLLQGQPIAAPSF